MIKMTNNYDRYKSMKKKLTMPIYAQWEGDRAWKIDPEGKLILG